MDSSTALDRQGLVVLDPDTCRRLLDLSPVGRVAYVHAGEPMILPVNHLRDGHGVVFRSATGSTLDAASRREPMAFEVDGYDEKTMTGWSVLVRGRSDLVTDPDEVERLAARDLHPWADGVDRPTWVRIGGTTVTGRRIAEWPSRGRTGGG
ncbi:pyridoxamine 5'-phosphate oxidase family protein [Salsipaludibacter albus]|uniref:pyridoxamine 5'-phosphate oxidase family protein n=1 Tax=Salsipaludibacter albus TaxID=2849650 RepID=UPI001EE4B5AE|nr:pyridoxamine 5'-phosphate oxidase family protein [Salsipaludibacter albus]MBY5161966.1 pyridoxamine 5'-phosphate oxidase family protein [Salsipaludibacter albus]